MNNPLYIAYHDEEWGVPCHDEKKLFEMLNLEGMQAGLSWETILNKRSHYRKVFDNWNAKKIAQYDESKVQALMQDAGIIRNQLKIRAIIKNANAYLSLCKEKGGLDAYLWGYVNHQVVINSTGERIITTPISDAISKDLKKRGFGFVGSTIIYAYMQAIGMAMDHDKNCAWRKPALK